MNFLTILSSRFLAVLVGRTFGPTTVASLSFAPKSASFLGIVLFTKATNVSMFQQIESISPVMSCLMKICFLFRICHLPQRCHHPLIFLVFCLINLRMLHIRLCYYLTTVQERGVALAWSSLPNRRCPDLLLLIVTSITAWAMQRAHVSRPPLRPLLARLLRRPRDQLDLGLTRLPPRLRGLHRPPHLGR